LKRFLIEPDTCKVEERRHQIDKRHRIVDDARGHATGRVDHERYSNLLLIDRLSVPGASVIAERLAMIRGHDEQRLRCEIQGFESVA
jgi:hypothetical protein